MNKSTRVLHEIKKKPRRVGHDPVLSLRLPDGMTARVEEWGEKQTPPLSRSEAIRTLIERGLKAKRV